MLVDMALFVFYIEFVIGILQTKQSIHHPMDIMIFIDFVRLRTLSGITDSFGTL